MTTDQQKAIRAVDAQLEAAGLPTYTDLAWRAHDVTEGIEDMKLPGAVPARLAKLKGALGRVFGGLKVPNNVNPFTTVDADVVVDAVAATLLSGSTSKSQIRIDALPGFEEWWKNEGQYGRAGGGDYEKTFAFNAWVEITMRTRCAHEPDRRRSVDVQDGMTIREPR